MKTGKTLVITGAYEVDIKEYPVPEAADDGMVIQVEAALICGSDGHFIKVNPESPFVMDTNLRAGLSVLEKCQPVHTLLRR